MRIFRVGLKALEAGNIYVRDSNEFRSFEDEDIPVDTVPWMKEIRDRLVEIWDAATAPTPESAVLITNFAFYYGDNESPSLTGMGAFFPAPNPRVPLPETSILSDLMYCLQTYDTVPRQI